MEGKKKFSHSSLIHGLVQAIFIPCFFLYVFPNNVQFYDGLWYQGDSSSDRPRPIRRSFFVWNATSNPSFHNTVLQVPHLRCWDSFMLQIRMVNGPFWAALDHFSAPTVVSCTKMSRVPLAALQTLLRSLIFMYSALNEIEQWWVQYYIIRHCFWQSINSMGSVLQHLMIIKRNSVMNNRTNSE
jgi:hypothetical protein